MGFSTAASQCLVAPPYVLAAVLMVTTSWYGDKYKSRAPVLVFNSVIAIVGLGMMGFAKNNAVQYFGAFIGIAGANANVPATMVSTVESTFLVCGLSSLTQKTGLSSKQHPRSMEARILQRNPHRPWRRRRHQRKFDLQISGCAGLH